MDSSARFRALGDHYTIGHVLGKGSSSVVRLGIHRISQQRVAVKCVDTSDALKKKRVLNEIEVMERLEHPNVIRLLDVFETTHITYLVTDLLDGGELFDRIVEKGSYSEREASSLIRTMLKAIEYMHSQDVVHRDLKPDNILFSAPSKAYLEADAAAAAATSVTTPANGSSGSCLHQSTLDERHDGSRRMSPLTKLSGVKLTDFGLAKITSAPTSTPCGTPGYMAPEILLLQQYDIAVDLWSLGVITYIILSGMPPFNEETTGKLYEKIRNGDYDFPRETWTGISSSAIDFVKGLLQVDPKARLSATEALDHPWVKGDTAVSDALLTSPDTLRQMLQSADRGRSRVRELYAINSARMSPDAEEVAAAAEAGMRFDSPGSSRLSSPDEASGFLAPAPILSPDMGPGSAAANATATTGARRRARASGQLVKAHSVTTICEVDSPTSNPLYSKRLNAKKGEAGETAADTGWEDNGNGVGAAAADDLAETGVGAAPSGSGGAKRYRRPPMINTSSNGPSTDKPGAAGGVGSSGIAGRLQVGYSSVGTGSHVVIDQAMWSAVSPRGTSLTVTNAASGARSQQLLDHHGYGGGGNWSPVSSAGSSESSPTGSNRPPPGMPASPPWTPRSSALTTPASSGPPQSQPAAATGTQRPAISSPSDADAFQLAPAFAGLTINTGVAAPVNYGTGRQAHSGGQEHEAFQGGTLSASAAMGGPRQQFGITMRGGRDSLSVPSSPVLGARRFEYTSDPLLSPKRGSQSPRGRPGSHSGYGSLVPPGSPNSERRRSFVEMLENAKQLNDLYSGPADQFSVSEEERQDHMDGDNISRELSPEDYLVDSEVQHASAMLTVSGRSPSSRESLTPPPPGFGLSSRLSQSPRTFE